MNINISGSQHEIFHILHWFAQGVSNENRFDELKELIMGLTQQEQEAVAGISAQLTAIRDGVDTLVSSDREHDAQQQATIDNLTATLTTLQTQYDALVAADVLDDEHRAQMQESINTLLAQRDSLQQQVDTHSSEVVAALGPVQESATALVEHIRSLGGTGGGNGSGSGDTGSGEGQ